jgi:hypothetical protein
MRSSSEIVLVAGVNYPKIRRTSQHPPVSVLEHGLLPGEWAELCLRYARAAAIRRPDCAFILFDFFTGVVAKFTAADVSKPADFGTRSIVVEFERKHRVASLLPVDARNYRAIRADDHRLVKVANPMLGNFTSQRYVPYFDGLVNLSANTADDYVDMFKESKGTRCLSAIDIYEYIAEGKLSDVGYAATSPPAVAELHFFAHSFWGGPVFVNTTDFLDSETPIRFQGDRDCRANKDFIAPNFVKLEEFRRAFVSGAFCIIWGCDGVFQINVSIKQALKKTCNHPAVTPRLDFDPAMQFESLKAFHDWYGGADKKSDAMNLSQLAQRIENKLKSVTYAENLAKASGCPTLAIPPGASSDFDTDRKQKSTLLMHVASEDVVISRFFEEYGQFAADLGGRIGDTSTDFDKEVGRGYLRYKMDTR